MSLPDWIHIAVSVGNVTLGAVIALKARAARRRHDTLMHNSETLEQNTARLAEQVDRLAEPARLGRLVGYLAVQVGRGGCVSRGQGVQIDGRWLWLTVSLDAPNAAGPRLADPPSRRRVS